MMEYKVLYEIGVLPLDLETWVVPLVAVIILVAAVFIKVHSNDYKVVKGIAFIVAALALVVYVPLLFNYFYNLKYYKDNRCEIIEGRVTDFFFSEEAETFTLDKNIKFRYLVDLKDGQINKSMKDDIYNGAYLRVYLNQENGKILKLEINN